MAAALHSMTYNWWVLIALCVSMQISSFIAGAIPLSFSLSASSLRFVSALGAGLLVGTALVVIIPEGIHSIYTSHPPDSHAQDTGAPLDGGGNAPAPTLALVGGQPGGAGEHEVRTAADGEHNSAHGVIGVMLVLGFVFMFLVDQAGGAHARKQAGEGEIAPASGSRRRGIGFTATLGLIVHAAADGVALGAAAATDQMGIEMIVFVAIMLHKAPAAFGLVTFLLHENLEKSRIRRHLFVFTLAAPLLACLTFLILSWQQDAHMLREMNATGMAMLFSAGTFLYVATVHVLPEITHNASHDTHDHNLSKSEITAIVIGALAPLVIAIDHHH